MVDCNPGASPVRMTENKQCGKDLTRTVVMIGARNMRRCLPYLASLGYETVNLTHIGWVGSDAAIVRLRAELEKVSGFKITSFVFDLLTCT